MERIIAFSLRTIAVFITIFHVSLVVAETPACKFCAPPPAPAPEFDSSAEPPVISADSPGLAPGDGEVVFDVSEHGAVADGGTESSSAFSAAWDAACSHAGRSTFYVPEGTYLVGPISFSGPCGNNQAPNIEIRGVLMAPKSLRAFPNSNWIVFKNLHGISITGGAKLGKLDAQGAAEAWKQASCRKSMKCKQLVTSLKFNNVSHGSISNITLSNGKGFHLGFHGSDNIEVYNVNILAPWDSPNTDGIHISHSFNIIVASSTVGVGDDCISIGPGSKNISVSSVQCGPGHGISVGSLGKYKNEEDVSGIRVRNCTINGTQNGIRVKTWPGAPASNASDMTFMDIVMINVSNPIIIDQEYCPSHGCNTTQPSLVKLTNLFFKNITGTYNTKFAVTLLCSSRVPCENIRLVGINLYDTTPETPRQSRFNVKGVIHGLEVLSSSF